MALTTRTEPNFYRLRADADEYFANQLYATDWTGASDADKDKAILGASRAADRIAYRGDKFAVYELLAADPDATQAEQDAAAATQTRQFPRDDADDPESWKLTVDAAGGTYTLTFNGEETGNIAYDATAATIETAIEALASVTVGDLTVAVETGGTDGVGPYTLTTAGTIIGQRFNTLAADATLLSGGASTAVILTLVDNIPDEFAYGIFEEAMTLLSGRLPGQEFRNLPLTTDGVGSTRTSSDRSQMPPEHTSHFFTSPEAWAYIRQFVDNNNNFTMIRS
jgi:hypothetical protein